MEFTPSQFEFRKDFLGLIQYARSDRYEFHHNLNLKVSNQMIHVENNENETVAYQEEISLKLYQKRLLSITGLYSQIQKTIDKVELEFIDEKLVVKSHSKDQVKLVLCGIKRFLGKTITDRFSFSASEIELIQINEADLVRSLKNKKNYCVFDFDLNNIENLAIHSIERPFIHAAKTMIEKLLCGDNNVS